MEIVVDGYKICYEETGKGEKTVIILQGWGTSLKVYESVAAAIAGKYRVIRFDFPGFGGSDEPKEAWSVDDYAEFFVKFVLALSIKEAALIGHSYGGRVIIKLANREDLPFKISNIVLVDSAGIVPKKTLSKKLKIKWFKFLKKVLSIKPIYAMAQEPIDNWKNRQGSEDYRNASPVMKQCLVKAINEDLTGLLAGIRQDTLLIWGDADTATPISDGQLMEKLIPNAGLAVIKDAGHFCFLDNPAVFSSILKVYFKC